MDADRDASWTVGLMWWDCDGVPDSGDEWGSNGAVYLKQPNGSRCFWSSRKRSPEIVVDVDINADAPNFDAGRARVVAVALSTGTPYSRFEFDITYDVDEYVIPVGAHEFEFYG